MPQRRLLRCAERELVVRRRRALDGESGAGQEFNVIQPGGARRKGSLAIGPGIDVRAGGDPVERLLPGHRAHQEPACAPSIEKVKRPLLAGETDRQKANSPAGSVAGTVTLSVLLLEAPIAPDSAAKPLGAALSGWTDQLAGDAPDDDNVQDVLELPPSEVPKPALEAVENRHNDDVLAASPSLPGEGSVNLAGLPAASEIVPALSPKAEVEA